VSAPFLWSDPGKAKEIQEFLRGWPSPYGIVVGVIDYPASPLAEKGVSRSPKVTRWQRLVPGETRARCKAPPT
jgi:hypothetical protein